MKNLYGVLHGNKWIMSHDLKYIVLGPSKRGGFKIKLGAVAMN